MTVVLLLFTIVCCGCMSGRDRPVRIGVIRKDDASAEAAAWESYLHTMGQKLGFTADFATVDSPEAEMSAIQLMSDAGCKAVLLFSGYDPIAAVQTASDRKVYTVFPVSHPTDKQYEQVKDNPYYLGSVAPTADTEFQSGYDMARFFVEEKGQRTFTLFGGDNISGSNMHVRRLSGMITYFCREAGTSYDGVKTREEIEDSMSMTGFDPARFSSAVYRITGYVDGTTFDDVFTAELTRSLRAGGICILSVEAGDTVSHIAHSITSADRIASLMSGGVGAISADYAACFDLGYTYNCGLYPSSVAPGLILTLAALDGHRIKDENGHAPCMDLRYWVATSRSSLECMLDSDSPESGYCYGAGVIRHYQDAGYEDLVSLCRSDYEAAVIIGKELNVRE